MTDEQLHEYWRTVDEKDKKKHRKLKRFFIILAVILAILTPINLYLFGWVRLSVEDLQLHIVVKDGVIYSCFESYPTSNFIDINDIGTNSWTGPITISDPYINVHDFENGIYYYPQKFWYSVRRILTFFPKGYFVDIDKYSTDGDWLNCYAYLEIPDDNGVRHKLLQRVSELYYENPDGELILLYEFDLYGDKDSTQNTDIGE